MARLNIVGFELGSWTDEGTTTQGTFSGFVQTGIANSQWALCLTGNTFTETQGVSIGKYDVYGNTNSGLDTPNFYFKFDYYASSFYPTTSEPLCGAQVIGTPIGQPSFRLGITSNGYIDITDRSGLNRGSYNKLLLNSWNIIEGYLNQTSDTLTLRINGNETIVSGFFAELGIPKDIQEFCLYASRNAPYIDNVVLDNSTWCGPSKILKVNPTSSSSGVGVWLNQSSAAATYEDVDDASDGLSGNDGDTTYATTSAANAYFQTLGSSLTSDGFVGKEIIAIKGSCVIRDANQTNAYKIGVSWSGTLVETTTLDGGGTYAARCILQTGDSSGEPITITKLSQCQLRVTKTQSQSRALYASHMMIQAEINPYAVATFNKATALPIPYYTHAQYTMGY